MKKNKIGFTIIMCLLLIMVTIGVTYAAFSFTKEGTVENSLETGTIVLTYTEGKTAITLNEAYPMSDEQGKLLTGENNVFDFTVTATLGKDTVITYEVTTVKIPITDMEPLLDNEVRLYLERAIDPEIEYTEIMAPTNFIPKGEVSEIGSPLGSMILDTGTFSNEGVTIHNYRLRMWVDENTEITDVQKKYGIKINVYAKQGVFVNEPTESSCFVFDETTGTITNYQEIDASGNECPKDVIIPRQIDGVDVVNIGKASSVSRALIVMGPFTNKGLTSVVIPNGVLYIDDNVFNGNQLTSVIIPNSVTYIGEGAFAINQLTSITLPNSITHIGNFAFNNNQLPEQQAFIYQRNADGSKDYTTLVSYGGNAQEVTVPNSVVTIKESAFALAKKMISLTIPETVTSIEENALDRTFSLERIINKTGKAFDWNSIITGTSDTTFVTGSVGSVIISAS